MSKLLSVVIALIVFVLIFWKIYIPRKEYFNEKFAQLIDKLRPAHIVQAVEDD